MALAFYRQSIRRASIILGGLSIGLGTTAHGETRTLKEAYKQTPEQVERQVAGWKRRSYGIYRPKGYDGLKPLPVILALHGGGNRREGMEILTCPDGDLKNPNCLNKLADKEGFLVVYPNGTSNPWFPKVRTFNAANTGKGSGKWACASGFACKKNIDDIAYFRALLDDLAKFTPIDPKRIFATGISNGGAMVHRLACEMSDRISAIASVAGGNQFGAAHTCAPAKPVSVIEFHGTTDPLWPFGSDTSDGENPKDPGKAISAPHTFASWATLDKCEGKPKVEKLPDVDSKDGTSVEKETYTKCKDRTEVVLYRILGGGHTWPGGFQYFPEDQVGRTTRDIHANQVMWEFFKSHGR